MLTVGGVQGVCVEKGGGVSGGYPLNPEAPPDQRADTPLDPDSPVDRQTPVKTLLCPKLRLRAVITTKFVSNIPNLFWALFDDRNIGKQLLQMYD